MNEQTNLELDPRADLVLPLLLNLFTAVGVSMVARTLAILTGGRFLPLAGLWAFLISSEAFLSTTLMDVRAADRPGVLRVLEILFMAAVVKVIAAFNVTGGLVAAALGGWDQLITWGGVFLLALAWWRGAQVAVQAGRLHPRLVLPEEEKERVASDGHAQAYAALQQFVLGQLLLLAIILGLVGWAQGAGAASWGWSGWAMLVEALLGVPAMLVAGQLRQQITWLMEGHKVDLAIFARWVGQGLSLLLLPLLAALLLPSLPRIPVERLLPTESRGAPLPLPKQPQSQGDGGNELFKGLAAMSDRIGATSHLQWVGPFLEILAALAVLIIVLLFLHAAFRQLKERLGGKELRGFLAVLAALAGWYEALFHLLKEGLKSGLRQAVAVPAETAAGILAESGLLGRYLPRWRRAPSDPRAAVRYYFARLESEAARKGWQRSGSATAAEFAAQLASHATEEEEALRRLTAAYQVARYSDHPIQAEDVSWARRTWTRIARAIGRRRR